MFKSQLEKIKDMHKGNKVSLSPYSGGLQLLWHCFARQTQQIRLTTESIWRWKVHWNFEWSPFGTVSSLPNNRKEYFGSDFHISPQSVSRYPVPDRLSDHDIVSGTLKIVIPPIKKPQRKVYCYQKGDYESMRSDALRFVNERYFNGYRYSRSVQENFNLITSFIQDSADKHIPSKTSRSVSSVP